MISLFSGISLHADAFLSRVEGTRSLVPVSRLISARKPVVLAVLVLALGLILAPDAAAQMLTISGSDTFTVTEGPPDRPETVSPPGSPDLIITGGGFQFFVTQSDTPGTYGRFSLTAMGNWSYTLDNARPAVQMLRRGQTVTEEFTVVAASDPSVTHIVTITINGENDPPEVTISAPNPPNPGESVSVTAGTTIAVTGSGMDVDEGETDTLTYRWSTNQTDPLLQGSFVDADAASTMWTAPTAEIEVILMLAATDTSGVPALGTGTASVTVTVTPPITIGGDTEGGVIEDGTVEQTTANGSLTIINANPADTTTFVAQNQTTGTYGTFSMDTGGRWTYMLADPSLTPAQAQAVQALRQGQEEMDVFPVMATVGARNITADVTITVTGTNDAPTVSISAPLGGNQPASGDLTVTGDGTDVDAGDTLRYSWSTDQSDPLLQGSFANSNAADTIWTAPPVTEDTEITLTLTATDDSGTANASITAEVTVTVIALDVEPDFGGQTIDAQLYVIDTDVDLTLPAATGGNGELFYRLGDASENLPPGLTFNKTMRVLSGRPTTGQGITTYNYAVTDSDSTDTDTDDDRDTVSLSFTITVETDDAPDFGDATITTPLYIIGNAVDLTLPEASGGNGERRYDLLRSSGPTLRALGLSFNSETRRLMGILAGPGTGRFRYRVRDEDNNEDPTDQSERPLRIIVQNDRRPNFGNPTIARQVFANGSMVDLTLPEATGGNGPPRYSISGVLPTGLGFDANTRAISGIPDEPLGATTSYTYFADDSDTNMGVDDRDTLRFFIDIFSIMGTDVGNVTEDGTAAQTMATGDLDIAPPGTANFVEQDDANGTYGTFNIGATGRWTYTLDNNDPDTNALAEGTTDTDTFTVTARATNSSSTMHAVTITVTGGNDAPTAAITSPAETNLAVDPGTTVTLIGTGSDPDATPPPDMLSYAWSATPEVGSFTGSDVLNTAWTAPDTIDGLITLTLTINDNQGGSDTATVTVIMALSPDLNGDGLIQARDAQTLYYLALPDEPDNLNALLNPLRGTASVAQLRNRAMAWLNRNPAEVSPDLNGDRRLDQEDARLLYYALRFEDELQASRALREALGFGSDMMTLNQALNLR